MGIAQHHFRHILAAALCGSFVFSAPLSAIAATKSASTPAARPLDKDARANLLLNRFTFGPTQADLASVRALGVDNWLERQLQPQSINDSAFEARLDVYPALRMTQSDRMRRYPEPAMLRQIAKTGVLPNDPELRAIVGDQVEFYQMVRENKSKADATKNGNTDATMMNGSMQNVAAQTAAQAQAQAAVANLEQATPAMPKAAVDSLVSLSPNDRYGRLLSMPPADLIALRKGAKGPLEAKITDGMTPLQKETLLALSGTNRMINAETQGSRLLRDIYSQRQLEAVMTDFWLNHFNVFVGANGQIPSVLPEYEQTIRANALGKFEDLLVATAQSPAMLMYLNNATSMGPNSIAAERAKKNAKNKQDLGLNENYAREVMELHTLGVTGGYTQKDVTELAKVFTGWTLDRPYDGGAYNFNMNRHEPGPKTVLGKTIQPTGEEEGYQALHMLATSPATAHFISTEIAQRFVSDNPPQAMVDRMAKAFLSSNGDIRQVLRAMIHSPEFFTTTTVNAKLKTPLEYVTSAVRASGADVSNPLPLIQSLQQLGMPLYGCQPPTGYKWDEATWLSSSALVNRMNFALSLSTNRIGGATVDWMPALTNGTPMIRPVSLTTGSGAADPEAIRKESLLESRLFEVPVSAQTRTAVITQGNDATAQQAAQQFSANGTRVLTDAEKQAQQQDRLDMMVAGKVKGPLPQKGMAQPRGLGAAVIKAGPPPADKQAAAMAGLLLGSPEFQRR
ncbi:Protein of unknown function (DUF1800) [Terriglobus roseus DSM 18391]|uniref:DUF1800 domain-containing protein n=1 Tax=Terriglobus roseus (strain DSM 18391 / NRRL B-41598 / KBS 63) TaxID=926566 RepID=I3ZHA2_TERRK|nr:DUF1800 domain-containing protein [Terriglobus roseus]AFL88279.1 Protein of unknown function (DUF1800) [Terriglobus roseus DSM 18391]AFL88620.1 Protein of unknown function (DUF1800) [Terriglobus roseus DSM 18391]